MKNLKFYDVKKKESFNSTKYELEKRRTEKGVRYFAIVKAKTKKDYDKYRLVSKKFYMENKK